MITRIDIPNTAPPRCIVTSSDSFESLSEAVSWITETEPEWVCVGEPFVIPAFDGPGFAFERPLSDGTTFQGRVRAGQYLELRSPEVN